MNTRLVAWVMLSLLAGCAVSMRGKGVVENKALGHFGQRAFYHATLPYSVRYLNPERQELVSGNWILDNFYTDSRGRTRPKETDEYMTTVAFDTTGDGAEDMRERVHRYDLRFLNRHTSAVIWHSTYPMSQKLADTELRVVAQKYVESVAGSGQVSVSLGTTTVSDEKRYSTKMLNLRDIDLDGHRALEFTFELANVEQLKLASDSRTRQVRIVLVRPSFGWNADGTTFPVLMVIGYSAFPEDFTRTIGDFARYVNQVSVNYDRFLERWAGAVNRCAGRPVSVTFEIDAAGKLEDLEVNGLGKVASGNLRTGRRVVMSEADRKAEECIRTNLQSADRFVSTGRKRTVRWRFSPSAEASSAEVTPYTTTAEAAPGAPAEPTAPAPGQTAAAPAATTPTAATPGGGGEDGLRAALDARKAGILACVGAKLAALSVRYDASGVEVSLRGDLAGSDEEGCVRHVASDLAGPTGEGSLIHVIR